MYFETSITLDYVERKSGRIGIVKFQFLPPNNTLTLQQLDEFIRVLYAAGEEADAVIVASANPNFFSNGLDGASLAKYSKEMRIKTAIGMIQAYAKLYEFSKPWAVEISGHALAGGAVIACAADYRFMISKKARIGFTEALMGLPLALAYMEGVKQFVLPGAMRSVLEGGAFKSEEALRIGLVDGLAETADHLRRASFRRLDGILSVEKKMYLTLRAAFRKKVLENILQLEKQDVIYAEEFVGSPLFEEVIQKIIKRNES